MRRFAGLSLNGPIPDETTILKFRHLLEKHHLGKSLFTTINKSLEREGVLLKEGTIVDATIISAAQNSEGVDYSPSRERKLYKAKMDDKYAAEHSKKVAQQAAYNVKPHSAR